MTKWFVGIVVLALVSLLSLSRHANGQGLRGDASSNAKPTWTTLGRLGHELLNAERAHASKPQAGMVDPYTRAWPNTIAICAIMKEERIEDVTEFIHYHRWIGVDSFYLRENGDECAIQPQLQPYIDAGVVDLGVKPGPKHPTQTNWYNECSRKASKLHSWVAFVDLDEFIVVLRKNNSIPEKDSLKHVLHNSFRYTAAVSMQWVLFGSGGHKEMPAEGQVAGFNRCTGLLSKQMKCLGNSYWFHYHNTFRPTHVHQCNFRFGAVAVLGNAEPINMWRVEMVPNSGRGPYGASYAGHLSDHEHKWFTNITNDYQIVLFHYVTRAQNSFVERKINRRSGIYATTYAQLQQKEPEASQDTLYARFEHEYGFDGDHAICQQGGPVVDAMRTAQAAGWSPIPPSPGLLKSKPTAGIRGRTMLT